MLHVPDVQFDPFVPGHARTALYLRPTGDAGPHFESAPLPRRVARDLIRERGAWADEAHVPAEDVPQLRQLVDGKPPQQTAGTRDARIALVDGEAGALVLRPDLHRPQLHELELRSVQADAPLSVEDGPAVVELDRECRGNEHGARHRQPEPSGRGVERAVHRVPSALAQTAGTPKRRYRTSDTTVAQVTST